MSTCVCVCGSGKQSCFQMTMLKWLHKCLCNCASVLCLLPVAACCQAEDTLTLFRMLCLLFQLFATVTHTHTRTHINMHMPQCIALWHCLCQYCCYVALFRVCIADRNAKTKQKRTKKIRTKTTTFVADFQANALACVRMCHTLMGSTAARILMDTHANQQLVKVFQSVATLQTAVERQATRPTAKSAAYFQADAVNNRKCKFIKHVQHVQHFKSFNKS